ncbi:MAG TPA: hypothetical protein VMM60_02215 [Ilumatobacter sp.]|nr:hypothetical protein [Ilumatobacter sp.]
MSTSFRLLMFLNPVEGREDEFHEWYETTHLDDVLRTAGFHAAQRWGLEEVRGGMDMPLSHLAIYEVEADSAAEVLARLDSTRGERAGTDTIDSANSAVWLFSALGERHAVDL